MVGQKDRLTLNGLAYDNKFRTVVVNNFVLPVNPESSSLPVPHQVDDCPVLQLAYVKLWHFVS